VVWESPLQDGIFGQRYSPIFPSSSRASRSNSRSPPGQGRMPAVEVGMRWKARMAAAFVFVAATRPGRKTAPSP
jgi:hypothetical protein